MKQRYRFAIMGLIAATILSLLAAGLLWKGPKLYTATVLPSLGGWHNRPHAINDLGQVVGEEHVGQDQRLFLWDRENGVRDLGSVTGDPLVINNAGQISGTMTDPNGNRQAFLWEPGCGRRMLGTLGGRTSIALAMNNHGQIVGISYNAANRIQFFLWDKATGMRELPPPDSGPCWPVSINDAGQVLMIADPMGSSRWFLLDPNGPILLNEVPPRTSLRNVNRNLCIAGIDESNSSEPYLVFWDDKRIAKRLFPVSVHAQMTRLNDKNQVACTSWRSRRWERWRRRLFGPRMMTDESISYLWDPARGKISLDRYLPDAERFLVVDLNNNGCLIGSVYTKDRHWHAVLLEPIPKRWDR